MHLLVLPRSDVLRTSANRFSHVCRVLLQLSNVTVFYSFLGMAEWSVLALMNPCDLTWAIPGLPETIEQTFSWKTRTRMNIPPTHVLRLFAMQIANWELIPDTDLTVAWEWTFDTSENIYFFFHSQMILSNNIQWLDQGLEACFRTGPKYHQHYSMTSRMSSF